VRPCEVTRDRARARKASRDRMRSREISSDHARTPIVRTVIPTLLFLIEHIEAHLVTSVTLIAPGPGTCFWVGNNLFLFNVWQICE
ncbi:hypothetical protein ARMGADRAFT_1019727, partial [Armillaria gallica]